MISLGIGDPDLPTPQPVVDALIAGARDAATHQYPTNHGSEELREAAAGFYRDRFGVELDPSAEVVPALGGKEAVGHIALALLDPGDVSLSPDPGYPPYTSGPLFAGAELHYLALEEANGFLPDLEAIPDEIAARANLLYLNYPNNPTGAVVQPGYFDRAVEFARAQRPRRRPRQRLLGDLLRRLPRPELPRDRRERRRSASRSSRSRRAGT